MNFKDMVQQDADTVIFNPNELGTEVELNGRKILAIKDSQGSASLGEKGVPGIWGADLVLYVRKKELPGEIKADMVLTVDKEKYMVQSVTGFYTIRLVLKRMGERNGAYR